MQDSSKDSRLSAFSSPNGLSNSSRDLVGEQGSQTEVIGQRLLERLSGFGHLLWESGLAVGPRQILDLVETLPHIDMSQPEDFYQTLKCCLLTRHEHEVLFNQLYTYYWLSDHNSHQQKDKKATTKKKPQGSQLRLPPSERKRLAEHLNMNDRKHNQQGKQILSQHPPQKDLEEDYKLDEGEPQGTAYSAIERLRQKDFESFSWEEIQEAKRLMAEMHWHLGQRITRRTRASAHGVQLDMRHIVRRNLKYGAEMLHLSWRERKRKPRPLIILCDISGSMSLYSRLLLHFIHTITNGLFKVEAFVFGTRLTRITRQLEKRDVDDAVRDVSKTVMDWSGGTRIGDALHTFNYTWGKRVLGRGAVVLLISDGWDRGEATVLRAEMERLQKRSHRLIWLNPLLGSPDYRPLTIGMKTALPFLDDFLPAHNLNSLIHLGNLLSTLDDQRPDRSPAARRQAIASWTKRQY